MSGSSSARWRRRRERDSFAARAIRDGYRSRAAYKLIDIDRAERLLRPGLAVLDLGAAPGSWSQYARSRVGDRGCVIAVDRLPMKPIGGVTVVPGDLGEVALGPVLEHLRRTGVDLVISDLAPNISGNAALDQARMSELLNLVLELCVRWLVPSGVLLVKVFEGDQGASFRKQLHQCFPRVRVRKPSASRARSREVYCVARGFVPCVAGAAIGK